MSTHMQSSPLSNSFFSEFNREYLHGAIIRGVQDKTGYKIDRQNDADLQALMRRVCRQLPHVAGQQVGPRQHSQPLLLQGLVLPHQQLAGRVGVGLAVAATAGL